jgi:hypothetical protein
MPSFSLQLSGWCIMQHILTLRSQQPVAHLRRRITVALGIFVATGLIVVGYRVAYLYDSTVLESLKRKTYLATKKEMLNAAKPVWAAHTFQSRITEQELTAALSRAISANSPGAAALTSEQLRQARQAALLFFNGYSTKDYDTYNKFRKPAPNYQVFAGRADGVRRGLKKYSPPGPEGLTDEDQFKWQWEKENGSKGGYIQAISLETISAGFAELQTQEIPSNWGLLPEGTPIVDMFHYVPYFIYPDQPMREGPANRPALFMTLVCIVKPAAPDFPIPVMLKSYWSASAGMWLPMEVSVASDRGRKNIMMF